MKTIISFPILLYLAIWLHSPLALGSVHVSIDRQTIYEGENFNLIIEVEGNTVDFDAGELTHDFFIQSQAVRQQVQQIGRRQLSKSIRIVTLEPKRAGQLIIPSLQVNNVRTNPLSINVLAAIDEQSNPPVLVELVVEPQNPYVQQQVTIKQQVLVRADLPILPGTLTIPVDDSQAVWHRLGDDRELRTERLGQTYRVLERRYAMFPTRSGVINFQPFTFDGRIAQAPRNSQGIGRNSLLFNAGRRIILNSETHRMEVKAIPNRHQTTWLPAKNVTIRGSWENEAPIFRVGEPLSFTVIAEVHGQDAISLPELNWDLPQGLQLYRDPETRSTRSDNDFLIGKLEQKLTVLPTMIGEFSLPNLVIPWWDTTNDHLSSAEIPAMKITVFPGIGGNTGEIQNTLPESSPVSIVRPSLDSTTSQPKRITEILSDFSSILSIQSLPILPNNIKETFWYGTTLVLLTIWFLTLLGWRRTEYLKKGQKPNITPKVIPSFSNIQSLLKRDNPKAVRTALLSWASSYWPQDPPKNLAELGQRVPNWAIWLHQLDRACYSNEQVDWMTDLHKPQKATTHQVNTVNYLPSLYP